MMNCRPFPWRYIKRVLETRESFFGASIEFTKAEFHDQAHACPDCGKLPDDLTWVPVDTAVETWPRGEGRSGFVTCCMECKTQIDFFVEDELTQLETELRAVGESSQDLLWSESDPVE
ncbi:MAG: hypothetical protein JWN70_4415 [Planctomycetaceae bacterium]|nr:hypothetical protein [Planctomycetaceae bacterium]